MHKSRDSSFAALARIHSDCTELELTALYSTVRSFRPNGSICDVGCGNGGSTAAICQGLKDAGIVSRGQVYAYDLFDELPTQHADISTFAANTSPYKNYISPIKIDLLEISNTPDEIDILFIDAAKSIQLNRAIAHAFLPNLNVPSIIINQDFGRPHLFWIHLMFSYLIESGAKYEIVDDMITLYTRDSLSKSLIENIATLPNGLSSDILRIEYLRSVIGNMNAKNGVPYDAILLLSLCSLCIAQDSKERAVKYLHSFQEKQHDTPPNLKRPLLYIKNSLAKL